MRNLGLSAKGFSVEKDLRNGMIINMDLSDEEFMRILDRFSVREMINSQGEIGILEEMDTDIIMKYLNDIGVETKWEDEKSENKNHYIGDFILRISKDDTIRVTSYEGVLSIHPKAENVVEIKLMKGEGDGLVVGR